MKQFHWLGMTMLAVVLTACSASPSAVAPDAMAGHDMTAMNHDAPYDAVFIDSMIVHHQGAITMAQEALAKAQRAEIKQFAQNVITMQDGEITQMKLWRDNWYPNMALNDVTAMDMGDMTVSSDASVSYDVRWIDAMIAHHQAAVTMANDALTKAEHVEIKNLAQAIIAAQSAEITQLEAWRGQ